MDDFDKAMIGLLRGVDPERPKSHHGTRNVIVSKTITSCYHSCPHFILDGGPSPTMMCDHPHFKDEPWAGAIISHLDDIQNGFPPACPLFLEEING